MEIMHRTHRVKPNETSLNIIAQIYYGDQKHWRVIYEHNRDVILNPNHVYPGMTLKIPHLHPTIARQLIDWIS